MKMYFIYHDIILLIIAGQLPSAQVYTANQIFANQLQAYKYALSSLVFTLHQYKRKNKTPCGQEKDENKKIKQNQWQGSDQAYDILIKLKTTSDTGESYLLTWKKLLKELQKLVTEIEKPQNYT